MCHHHAHHEQRAHVPERDHPERTGPQGFLGGEVDVTDAFGPHRRAASDDAGSAIDLLTEIFGPSFEVLGEPPCRGGTAHPGHRCGRSPAEERERQHDERHAHPADAQAHAADGQRPSTQPLEPAHNRHGHGHEAAEARAHSDQHERRIELPQRVDLAEEHESRRHEDRARPGDGSRTEAIEQPALRWPQQRCLGPVHRDCARQGRLAPAEFALQLHQVRARGMHEQGGLQALHHAPRSHHLPSAEDGAAFGHRHILPDRAGRASVQDPSAP